ncbi:type II toxin-antitoxin system VapC family toxin [Glycomyces arizonensis]|uniref:type II toxin-antitoxin system VapC family toxin n=1 Tax=Glycomyces arizonensis TaxID=256035 RepID=UPI00047C8885|nr:type II toxin-antitoxin system VapC family toxin [Glycomyces arizonensis]
MTDSPALIVDASAVVAQLTTPGERGKWFAAQMLGKQLFSSEMLHYEVTNILRRGRRQGALDETAANLAFQDLQDMAIRLEPFSLVANRIWKLRDSVTAYDASYVAVAEWRRAPLLTADLRLTRSHGPKCEFITPPMS